MGEKEKKPKKAILFKLTFYKNDELKEHINKEFNVIAYNPDWQIPIALQINGKRYDFELDEVRITEWSE